MISKMASERNLYYERYLLTVFKGHFRALSLNEQYALEADCNDLCDEMSRDREKFPLIYGTIVVAELLKRIGGVENLASYVACLMAKHSENPT